MNCADCRDLLVASLEGLLDAGQSRLCQEHLDACPTCRAEQAALTALQHRLAASARAAAGVSLADAIMRRVLQSPSPPQPERSNLMSRLLTCRWRFGLGAAAVAVAVLCLVLATPRAHARAQDVLARGAQAVARLTSIHLRGQLRTLPADNFSMIVPQGQFYPIELWKQFEPELKWRIEKPQRVIVMDGQSTVMLIKPGSTAVKFPERTTSAFDTDWLHRIANLSNTITNELKNAQARGWQLRLDEQRGTDGRPKAIVTVMAKSGVPDNDYCKNTFIEAADTRRVYRFDAQTELLEDVQLFLVQPSGETQLFELSEIDYNPAISPSVWNLELPADVSWGQLPDQLPKLPDNQKYASMTPQQAARAFFEACSRQDWDEVSKFISPVNDRLKEYLGGLELISLGEPFTSKVAAATLVPYEIKLRPQEFFVRVSNTNAAGRYVITGIYDRHSKLLHDLTWKTPPAVLPDNQAYARLSPTQAVKAYFDAGAKCDWQEMRKFAPGYDVESDQAQVEAAKNLGVDVTKNLPTREVLDAAWSAEQSAWLVKCRESAVGKQNLGVRKDNPAGRWQVDGGI